MGIAAGLRVGDPVLFRSVHGARVRWAFPHRFAGERDGRIALYCVPGTVGRLVRRGTDGRYLARWVAGDEPDEHTWVDTHVLWLVRPGERHGLGLFWDEAWDFVAWYVNLQAPLVPTPLGFDSQDWDLDIVVEPDGTWAWKDEDDFAEAQALGVLDAGTAAAARAEGERVVAERPWPTGWEDWRPRDGWTPPALPADWHVVEAEHAHAATPDRSPGRLAGRSALASDLGEPLAGWRDVER